MSENTTSIELRKFILYIITNRKFLELFMSKTKAYFLSSTSSGLVFSYIWETQNGSPNFGAVCGGFAALSAFMTFIEIASLITNPVKENNSPNLPLTLRAHNHKAPNP